MFDLHSALISDTNPKVLISVSVCAHQAVNEENQQRIMRDDLRREKIYYSPNKPSFKQRGGR